MSSLFVSRSRDSVASASIAVVSLAFLLAFGGCCSREMVGVPSLLHPGDIDTQRAKMERFDPFPQTGFGPAVEGGRGRGFENAIAPERRASLYTETLVEGTSY